MFGYTQRQDKQIYRPSILNINNESMYRRSALSRGSFVPLWNYFNDLHLCTRCVLWEVFLFALNMFCVFSAVPLNVFLGFFFKLQGDQRGSSVSSRCQQMKQKPHGLAICLPAGVSSRSQTERTWRIYLNLHRKSSWSPDAARRGLQNRMRRRLACWPASRQDVAPLCFSQNVPLKRAEGETKHEVDTKDTLHPFTFIITYVK